MDHGKGAGTTDPAPVGLAGDAGPMKPGGTKTVLRLNLLSALGVNLQQSCGRRALRPPILRYARQKVVAIEPPRRP